LAAYSELTIEQGATFTSTVNVQDIFGNPIDLSNYTTASMMRKSYYSSSSIIITSVITGNSNGEITLTISSNTTANINPGRYVYDVIITDTETSSVTRVVEGIATVLPSVTR